MNRDHGRWALCAALLCGAACGDDKADDEACDLRTHGGCEDDEVCEEVVDGEPACFAPITLEGRVFDLATDEGIEGATVVARDGNGAPRSDVVRSGPDGAYTLQVPSVRTEDGTPVDADPLTLRVAAADYQAFPLPPRMALPIDLDVTVDDAGAGTVDHPATSVGLVALPNPEGVTVVGSVGEDGAGTLVVAQRGDSAVSTAIADSDGDFVLFNVPEGDVSIGAWGKGVYGAPTSVSVGSDGADDVAVDVVMDAGASVSGNVNIVNAPGGSETSVILVLESTFDETLIRGEAPQGLRVTGVTGAFELEDVPPGRYAVLAAFENDDLVRDPDEGIAGTEVVRVEVTAGADITLDASFKVTEALETVSPGADMLETVGPTPTLEWADDSSEDGYELRVYDTFGLLIYENTEVPRVTGSATVSYVLDEADLEPAMIYQFRAFSWREGRGSSGRSYISATEDLRGTFQVE